MVVISIGGAIYSVKFSPWRSNHIGYISNSNYGIQGGGLLKILEINGDTSFPLIQKSYKDAFFEFCWLNTDVIVSGNGDGCLCFWSVSNNSSNLPLNIMKIHSAEVHSVDTLNNHIVTASWDGSMKVIDCLSSSIIQTFTDDTNSLKYDCAWNKWDTTILASCDSNRTVSIWDTRTISSPQLVHVLTAHYSEVLSCSWSNSFTLYSCDTTGMIFIWDLRSSQKPVSAFFGHERAVRKILSINENEALSCGYDFTVKHWMKDKLQNTWKHHSEFVYGLDYLRSERKVMDGAWDGKINIFAI